MKMRLQGEEARILLDLVILGARFATLPLEALWRDAVTLLALYDLLMSSWSDPRARRFATLGIAGLLFAVHAQGQLARLIGPSS